MTAPAPIYQRMGIARLQQMAATEGEHQDEAARAYVDRLCDMEMARRRQEIPSHVGWHPCSPGFGDGTGRSTVKREPLAEAYDRGEIRDSYWHNRARSGLAKLPERRLVALLIAAAKMDPRTEGPFSASYDQIAASLGHYLQLLGWPPGAKALGWLAKGQAIKRAAWEARMELVMQAKVGVL